MATENNVHPWLTEYKASKEKRLEEAQKSANTMATVAGIIATASALVVAGSIASGNGLEALQSGGTTIAMAALALSNASLSTSYKDELGTLKETKPNELFTIKTKLETLRYQLERKETNRGMNYTVASGFLVTSIAHVLEILEMRDPLNLATGISSAAITAIVSFMYYKLAQKYKSIIKSDKDRIAELIDEQELDELSKQPIPELAETQPGEEPMVLRLEDKK